MHISYSWQHKVYLQHIKEQKLGPLRKLHLTAKGKEPYIFTRCFHGWSDRSSKWITWFGYCIVIGSTESPDTGYCAVIGLAESHDLDTVLSLVRLTHVIWILYCHWLNWVIWCGNCDLSLVQLCHMIWIMFCHWLN